MNFLMWERCSFDTDIFDVAKFYYSDLFIITNVM
jgi:hypothetical protein